MDFIEIQAKIWLMIELCIKSSNFLSARELTSSSSLNSLDYQRKSQKRRRSLFPCS